MPNAVLTLCGTYTLDPLADVIEYWFDLLDIYAERTFAPYAQMFQQLLDPSSTLRSNRCGANVVLLRWTDLLPRPANGNPLPPSWSELEGRVADVASALAAQRHDLPCLVLVGPADRHDPLLERATAALQSRLAGTPNLSVEPGERMMQRYGVGQVHDATSDRFGHVPFTPDAMAALGTAVARWFTATRRAPIKLVAVDGDHTLWSGVVAEDGADAVEVDGARAALQRVLVQQADAGRLLCLLSKNEHADVREVFDRHPDMPLQWSHLFAHRVDWNPKPDNLRAVATELELGLDSALFIDDNPIECAQMRASCPAVITVQVPAAGAQLDAFAEHLWLFDLPTLTAEDRARARMYHDNASRADLRRGADSLQAFLDGLELVVEIAPPSPAQWPRLAQLTQRTNQFNASLIRCDERALQAGGVSLSDADGNADSVAADASAGFHRSVRARDRFGDYGVVGQIRGLVDSDCLAIDLFMLSCRALGRGIEHRMIASAGQHALSLGLARVAVLFCPGERNAPAQRFLQQLFTTNGSDDETRAAGSQAPPGRQWFQLPARDAASLAFDAAALGAAGGQSSDNSPADGSDRAGLATATGTAAPTAASRPDVGARYEHIAHALTTGAAIRGAMAARVRPRADLGGFVAPAPGLEATLAAIWQQVLRIDRVGGHDRFQDLGGKSIHLVQVHGLLLDRLDLAVDITTLFQHPTVASLAAHLAARAAGDATPPASSTDAARLRGMRMRDARNAHDARTRAANRTGVTTP